MSGTDHIEANPFWVLELPWSATATELLRQKQKLLGMLELEVSAGRSFDSPSGRIPRDAYLVRAAASGLEDGGQRLFFEFWSLAMPTEEGQGPSTWPACLSELLKEHLRLRKTRVDTAAFEKLCTEWEEELGSEGLRCALAKRSAALRVHESAESLSVLRESVEVELSALLQKAGFDLDDLQSDMAQEAASQYQAECAEELQDVSRDLLSVSGWQERVAAWVRFREQHRKMVAGRGRYLRHLSFEETHSPVSDLAFEAYEERYFRLARELYAWIRDEAEAVGDESEQERCAHNADLCRDKGKGRHLYDMEICRNCTACVRSGAYCSDCGGRMKPRFCSGCGKPVERKFCSGCGTRSQA